MNKGNQNIPDGYAFYENLLFNNELKEDTQTPPQNKKQPQNDSLQLCSRVFYFSSVVGALSLAVMYIKKLFH